MYHFRSTSKATYLPRQTHDKQQLSDPDHGSYKLKLASNEDCINHDQYNNNNGSSGNNNDHTLANKCNNLPDVLPLAVKYNGNHHQQKQRYFSPPSSKQKAVPQSAPVISTNNLKSLFNFASSKLNTHVATDEMITKLPQVTSSSPGNGEIISPKYTSQSVFDLQNTNDLLCRDDPPPYTDTEIKKELIQTLEFTQPIIDQLIVPSSTTIISPVTRPNESPTNVSRESIDESISQSSPKKRLSNVSDPPSYEETQSNFSTSSPSLNTLENTKESPPTIIPTRLCSTSTTTISETENNILNNNKTLVQRTEVVLRLVAPTSETASQTDEDSTTSFSDVTTSFVFGERKQETISNTISYASRKISPEEVDCDNLSKDLVSQLSPLDKLHSILGEYSIFQRNLIYFFR